MNEQLIMDTGLPTLGEGNTNFYLPVSRGWQTANPTTKHNLSKSYQLLNDPRLDKLYIFNSMKIIMHENSGERTFIRQIRRDLLALPPLLQITLRNYMHGRFSTGALWCLFKYSTDTICVVKNFFDLITLFLINICKSNLLKRIFVFTKTRDQHHHWPLHSN